MSARAALYAAAHGALVLDAARRLTACTTATSIRGFAESTVSLKNSDLDEQLRIAAQSSMTTLAVGEGQGSSYQGRLEDVPIGGRTLQLRAFGAARAVDDIPYTALWSETRTNLFSVLTNRIEPNTLETRYQFGQDNQLLIAPRKNEVFGNTTTQKGGGLYYDCPDRGSRQIVGVQFSFQINAPDVNWTAALLTYTLNPTAFITSVWSQASVAGVITGSIHLSGITGADRILFFFRRTVADAVYAGETGFLFLNITNLRFVTSVTNRVNTTLTVARANGAGVTCTVGSTARMYVGQQLVFTSGANSEMVTVASVPTSTTFTCTVVNGPGGTYPIGTTVQGHVVYPDEIVRDCVTTVAALNTNQLSSATNRIQTGDIDCLTDGWEDASMSSVLSKMASYGDTAKNPWGWWVDRDKNLVFERRGLNGYTFYVDVTPEQLDVIRSTADAYNSAYAVYQDANGRTVRSTASTDAAAVSRYGLTRRTAVPVQTTSSIQAGLIRDTYLQDKKTPQPKIRIPGVTALYDAGGNRVPLSAPNAGRGDTIRIRNLSPVLPGDAEQLRSFRLGYCQVDWLAGTLTLESETPPEGLETLYAQQEART